MLSVDFPHAGIGWEQQPMSSGVVIWRSGHGPGEAITPILAVSAAQAVQALYHHPSRRPLRPAGQGGVEHPVNLTGVRMLVIWPGPQPILIVQPERLARAPFN